MSVTFRVKGERANWETGENFLNLSNVNAREVLAWLGYEIGEGLLGELDARELAARCRRRLWNEPRNHDPELPGWEGRGAGGVRVVQFARRPGYLREKTEALLKLAERAGEGAVAYD
jgi:hypothetical protein